MKIAILGLGIEGKSVEKYFKSHFKNIEIDIFDGETPEQFRKRDYSSYDIIFRSPSIPPLGLPNESSVTKYFFDHCPCGIIGVTATKGKGTTCSIIKALLDADKRDAYLVGNIGVPALDVLDQLTAHSVVVYELSSFQLWDLQKSPHISIIGYIEPDHLNVHKDYADYTHAKSNIASHQSPDDYCIFYSQNSDSVHLADTSPAHKIPYPFTLPAEIISAVKSPGAHNLNNTMAAIAAVACLKNISPDEYLSSCKSQIITGLQSFHGLPHRLEEIRTLNGIDYYDDNFSTNASSTRVAINAFPNDNLVLILGGRDKTDFKDLPEIYDAITSPQVKKVVLIGESGHELSKRYQDNRFTLAESLTEAVNLAKSLAESLTDNSQKTIILMSPAAASFDMFKNVYDRGEKYQNLIASLQ